MEPEEEIVDLTPEAAEAPPIGRKITVEKKIFSRPLTAEESEETENEPEVVEEVQDDVFDDFDKFGVDEVSNDLLNFFDADSGDSQHRLRVFQIVKPEKGTKFIKGGSIFRGEIPYGSTFLQDVQETFGGGVFRLQVCGERADDNGRMRFGIIKSKTVTISALPSAPKFDDPRNQTPQVPYLFQSPPPPPGEQPVPKSKKEELKEVVEIVEMVDKLRGRREETSPVQSPTLDPETAAWSVITKNPGVMEKLTTGIASFAFGKKGDGVTWEDVAMETIRSGQAPQIIRETIASIFGGITSLIPKWNNQNGQAPPQSNIPQGVQMAPHQGPGPALRGPIPTFPQGTQGPVPIQQNAGPDQTVQAGNQQAGSIPNQQALNPADALIMTLVQMMQTNKPVEEAVAIIDRACVVDPELSPSVDDFIGMPIKRILSVLSDYDPKIKEIPHAKEWVTKLKEAFAEE